MVIENVSKKYKKVTALQDISLKINNKGFLLLSGKSGAGKSTLINILSGLDTDYEGDVFYRDIHLKNLSRKELNAYRNSEIGFIFQDFCLIENKTVFENLSLPLEIQNSKENQIEKLLHQFGLEEHKDKYPSELSGGEQQRVAIARALLKNPNILIADEPTSSLDLDNATMILDLLKEISETKLVIVVSHDISLIKPYADRIILLENGKIRSDSQPLETIQEENTHHFTSAHLSWKKVFSIFLKLKISVFKIVFTLFLFILCFSLFTIGFAFATQNKNKLILQNMYADHELYASVSLLEDMYKSENTKYEKSLSATSLIPNGLTDQLLQEKKMDLLKTNSLSYLSKFMDLRITFKDEYIIKRINGIEYKIDSIESTFSGYLEEKTQTYESFDFHLVEGNYPTDDNEIAIPVLIYNQLKEESEEFSKNRIYSYRDLLKYTVKINQKEFQICGIFSIGNADLTRYEHIDDQNLSEDQKTSLSTEHSRLISASTYSTIVFNDGYFTRNPLDKNTIFAAPFLMSSANRNVIDLNGSIDYCLSDKDISLQEDHIIWFTEPKDHLENNEVLLPTYAQYQKEEIQNGQYDYLSFSTTSDYESAFQDIKIAIQPVGIYTEGFKDSLITSETFKEELYNTFGFWGSSSLWIKLSGNLQKDLSLLRTLQKYNLGITNPYQLMANQSGEFLQFLTLIMLGITVILFLILILMLISYYKTLLYHNKKEIGLYFSFGYSRTDVAKPYILHSFFITLLTFLLSIGVIYGIYYRLFDMINTHFATTLNALNDLWISILLSALIYVILTLPIMLLCYKKYFKGNNPFVALKR